MNLADRPPNRKVKVTHAAEVDKVAHIEALYIGASLRKTDHVFTVVACGTFWDVYSYEHLGKKGMIAFRFVDGDAWNIGFLREGVWTPEAIKDAILQAGN